MVKRRPRPVRGCAGGSAPTARAWEVSEAPRPRRSSAHLPAAELLRENKRMLDKAIRELDRERMGLQAQEKKLIQEIKKMAKEGQMVGWRAASVPPRVLPPPGAYSSEQQAAAVPDAWHGPHTPHTPPLLPAACAPQDAVKVMAKSLVRNRHAVNKLFQLKSQLQAVSLRIAVRGWAAERRMAHA